MICENCGLEHEGTYGSGRFCKVKCARGFSTKHRRKELNIIISKTLKTYYKDNPDKAKKTRNSWPQESTLKFKNYWKERLINSDFNKLGMDAKRRRVIIEQKGECKKCGISEWQGHPLTLELEHINGNNKDNIRTNLEALCPNCHSITPTWRGRNKASTKRQKTVSNEDLLRALLSYENIRQALISVNLSPKGNNYKRAKNLLLFNKI